MCSSVPTCELAGRASASIDHIIEPHHLYTRPLPRPSLPIIAIAVQPGQMTEKLQMQAPVAAAYSLSLNRSA